MNVVFVTLPFGITVWRAFNTPRDLVRYLRSTANIVCVKILYE